MQANILELTGRRPRLEAGRRLRAIAAALACVKDWDSATAWLVSYSRWEQDFASFLDEKSEYADGSVNGMHQRLVKARRMIPGASGRASRSRSSTRARGQRDDRRTTRAPDTHFGL